MTETNNVKIENDKKTTGRQKRIPHTRVNDEEYAAVMERVKQAGLSPCEYVRAMCLHGKVTVKQQHNAASSEAVRQLLAIGNNLNQIAKHANNQAGDIDHDRLHHSLDQLDTLMMQWIDAR